MSSFNKFGQFTLQNKKMRLSWKEMFSTKLSTEFNSLEKLWWGFFIKIWVIQPQKLKLSSIEIIQAPHLSSCGKMRRCCWNSWTANSTRALCPMEMFPSSLPRFILAIKVSLETKTWSIFLIFNDSVEGCETTHLSVNCPKSLQYLL